MAHIHNESKFEGNAMPRRGYPYSRASILDGGERDSLARQSEWAPFACEREGWLLDDTYSLSDDGRSGYHKKNLTPTAGLTRFLRLVEDGIICAGSVLIIERLDRLTRQEIFGAAELLFSILGKGIWICTKDPDRVYRRETATLLEVMEPLWIMYAAYIESSKKADWTKHAWESARKRAEETGLPLKMGRPPSWIQRTPEGYVVDQARANIVRLIHAQTWAGMGYNRILGYLQEQNIPTLDTRPYGVRSRRRGQAKRWSMISVRRLLRDKITLGENRRGEQVYPPILTDEEYQQSQQAVNRRVNKRGRPGKWAMNLFVGMAFNADSRLPLSLRSKDGSKSGEGLCYVYLSDRPTKGCHVRYEPCRDCILDTVRQLSVVDVSDQEKRGEQEQAIAALTAEQTRCNVQAINLQASIDDPDNAEAIPALAKSLARVSEQLRNVAKQLEALKWECRSGRTEALATAQTLVELRAEKSGVELEQLDERIREALLNVVESIWVRAQKVTSRTQITHVQIWLRSGRCRYVRINPGRLYGVEPWDCRPEVMDFRRGT